MLNLNGGNNQNLQPNFIRFVITIFCLGITLGSGLGYGFKQGTDSTPQSTTRTVTQGQNQSFGLAEYIRLELGMTPEQVESILGRGVETERSETATTYIWNNGNNSSITVIFKSGKLARKAQVNLK